MEFSEGIEISGVEHHLNRAPADPAAAQPDQRAQARGKLPEVEDVPGRERVEIAGEQVEPAIVLPDGPEQCVQLEHAALLRPCGVNRAEVYAEHRKVDAGRMNLKKGMARDARPVPGVHGHRLTTHEPE